MEEASSETSVRSQQRRMGIGASTEKGKDKMNKEMVKDVNKESAWSKSKK